MSLKEENNSRILEKQTNYINETNELKEILGNLIYGSKYTGRMLLKEVSDTLIIFLENHGRCIKTDIVLYYFSNNDKRLYNVSSTQFKYYVSDLIGLPHNDQLFKGFSANLESYIFKNGINANIKKFSYFDKEKQIVYLHNNKSKIIKISKDNISIINNGEDGIIFLANNNYEEWNYKSNITSDKKYLDDLILSLSFNEDNLSKNELFFVIKQYILSLFFPNLLTSRPIITFIGQMGSGKSFFLEQILTIFFGSNTSMANLSSNEKELKINLINEYLCMFDNVDDKVSNGKIDILCSASTGISIKSRALYTNNDMIEIKVNCFIGLTSRNPTFKRDDIANRLLIINLNNRGEYGSSNEEKNNYIKNRDLIMSGLCIEIQNVIKNFEDFKNFKTNFRLSDFANFIINNNKSKESEIRKILIKLEKNQLDLTNSTDSLLILIESLLEDVKNNNYFEEFKEGIFYTSNQLHDIFFKYSKNNPRVIYSFSSPKSLGRVLGNNIKAYKINGINVIKKMSGSNLHKYSISKIISSEDIKKVFQ